MGLGRILYQLLLAPLILIYELVFGIAKGYTDNNGFSIFVLSLTVNVLLLPLYRRADAIQDEERALEKKMERWVSHIKKTFSGDERFMMLQAYYRENDYKPYYALKGSLPLLLEIPFFIAAYRFLSGLSVLKGSSFGPISDLGAPDGMLSIAGISINVLPILMTLINFVSSTIYAKGFSLKDKIKLYGMAVIFLVLLYDSPSGLVVYWTLNNLFSLFKNIFTKLPGSGKIIKGIMGLAGAGLFVLALVLREQGLRARLFLAVLGAAFLCPLLVKLIRVPSAKPGALRLTKAESSRYFWLGSVFLILLTGALIPSSVVYSSPAEFIVLSSYRSPLFNILSALLLAAGLFAVWCAVFFYIAPEKARGMIALGMWLLSGIAITDYMFFGTDLGTLTQALAYENPPVFSIKQCMFNLAVLLAVCAVLFFIWNRKRAATAGIYVVLIAAVFGMSVLNTARIQKSIPDMKTAAERYEDERAHFTFSKNGKNVFVLMLDRSISSYFPYIINEIPKLKEQFAGFTYYPNTLSYGGTTNTGSAPIYGGYEYTPEEMNKRSSEPLADKQNEALKVMPVSFLNAGYKVTVCDPPFAGYRWIPDLSIFDGYPQIDTYLTEQGQFYDNSDPEELYRVMERSFFCYSIMKSSPLILQTGLYDNGTYYDSAYSMGYFQVIDDASHARGVNRTFINSWYVLKSLPEITKISEGSENVFVSMCNSTTHEVTMLKEPEYEPAERVDNSVYDAENRGRFNLNGESIDVSTSWQLSHYQVNAAALKTLGIWFDYLRENGVWDNTRIIIVSDHGWVLSGKSEWKFGPESTDEIMKFNPLLLVKDFGSTELKTDYSFMTHADTPTLAFKDLISDPKNPFTGKSINSDPKNIGEQHVVSPSEHRIDFNNGNVFLPGRWYAVKGDNMLDSKNWSILGDY